MDHLTSGFAAKFTKLLENLELSRYEKDIILSRFVQVVQHTENQYLRTRLLFLILVQLITIAGVFIAALTPLEKVSWMPPTGSMVIFWIVWSLAIALTLANKWLYAFNIHKKYVLNIIVLEKFYSEGWSFLSGIGHYQNCPLLSDRYMLFCSRIEKLKLKSLENLPELENSNAMNEFLATGTATNGIINDTTNGTPNNINDDDTKLKSPRSKLKKNSKSTKVAIEVNDQIMANETQSVLLNSPLTRSPHLLQLPIDIQLIHSAEDNVANSTDIIVDI